MNDDTTNTNNPSGGNSNSGGIFGTPLVMNTQNDVSSDVAEKTVIENEGSETTLISPTTPNPSNPPSPVTMSKSASDNILISPKKDDEELVSMGVTFVSDNTIPQEKNIFSKDSSFKEKEQEESTLSQDKKPLSQSVPQPTAQAPANSIPETESLDTGELEADFSKTFNTPIHSSSSATSPDSDPIGLEEEKLKRLHKELKDKAKNKKIVLKEGLEKLQKEKESLGKELEDIKELELIASKIEEKLKNLETIDTEIDSLEKKAHEELAS